MDYIPVNISNTTQHYIFQLLSFFPKWAASAQPNALFVNRKLIPAYCLQVDTEQPWSKLWAKSESLYIQLAASLFLLDL